jgi:hypothetical protein
MRARIIAVIMIKQLKTKTKATKSVFFFKSSAPAAADSVSEDEFYEPRPPDFI